MFKRPIHMNKLSLAQIVMVYHNEDENAFQSYLTQMIKDGVPVIT